MDIIMFSEGHICSTYLTVNVKVKLPLLLNILLFKLPNYNMRIQQKYKLGALDRYET